MPTKRLPSGKARPGEQLNQDKFLNGTVTFTGSTVVDLKRVLRNRSGSRRDERSFVVIGLVFQDAGGAATVHRLAHQLNGDGTFTINASKDTTVAGVTTYVTATNPCTVVWTVLVTN